MAVIQCLFYSLMFCDSINHPQISYFKVITFSYFVNVVWFDPNKFLRAYMSIQPVIQVYVRIANKMLDFVLYDLGT